MWVLNIFYLFVFGGSFIFPFNFFSGVVFVDSVSLDFFFVCCWGVFLILLTVYFYCSGWVGSFFFTSLYLYFIGFFKTFMLNLVGCYSVLNSNTKVFWTYVIYIVRILWTWFGVYFHVWRPVFKRSGYVFLLNSSRARWVLSQSHNIYRNK